jgi:rare lipoprotein A (peptidoglycan hydrolase)
LRQWLGPKWRGTLISVGTGNGTSRTTVRVRLSDWCACGHGRLIDLSDDAFAQLAPLSKGIIGVEVTRVVHVALPATDTK